MDMKIMKDGEIISCDVITMFKDDSNNIDYIVYTDGSKDEDGNNNIFASRYVVSDESLELLDIEEDNEWDMIDEVIRSIDNYDIYRSR